MSQISIFDGNKPLKIDKPIRLIECFAGYGSQALALKYLGVPFEHHRIAEWAVKSIQAYKDMHFHDDKTDYSNGISFEEVVDFLFEKGISADYNKPMTREHIKRMGENKCRIVYNNIIATHNLVSVTNVKGKDLEIRDTDRFTYLLTYSFPCQDLSQAGLSKGMKKGSGTRSGLLWEIERILDECEELPQILLMENVPQVIGEKNRDAFRDWFCKLESLGYKSYYNIMNGKDYEIPQNRERCFMVSCLGDYYYDFPEKVVLRLKLRDLLEKEVENRYYLSKKMIESIRKWNAQQDPLKDIEKEKIVSPCITARGAGEFHSGMVLIYDYYNKKQINGEIIGTITSSASHNGSGTFFVEETIDGRIRTITPKECFRLMGVKDEDFERISKNQSKSSLYHLAGDSIVTNCLMAIFKEML